MNNKRPIGFWILVFIGILYFCFAGLLGQVMTVINYDFAASIGMQEARDLIGEMGVVVGGFWYQYKNRKLLTAEK